VKKKTVIKAELGNIREPKKKANIYSNVKVSSNVVIPTQQMNYKNTVEVSPMWNPNGLKEMQAALTSYFLTRSIVAEDKAPVLLPTFYDGMLTMWRGFATQSTGTPALSTRLRIIHDLIKGFEQKDVIKHKYYKVSFSWKDVILPNDGSYSTGWNKWDFVVPG